MSLKEKHVKTSDSSCSFGMAFAAMIASAAASPAAATQRVPTSPSRPSPL